MSTFCLAPGTASAARLAADTTVAEPDEAVLGILHQTFFGYVSVSFPADAANSCIVVEASPYRKKWKEFFQTWYSVTVEARCPGAGTQTTELWIECTQRGSLVCELKTPPPETLAAINAQKSDAN